MDGDHAGICQLMHIDFKLIFESRFLFSSADPSDGNDLGPQLMDACREGDVDAVEALLESGADPTFSDADGVTPLMCAAEGGHIPLIVVLLEAGAPWNAQDKDGHTAGEYATGSGNREVMPVLLDWAVRSELILSATSGRTRSQAQGGPNSNDEAVNSDYLGQKLRYEDGKLMDEDGEAVMMGWEAPLMERHADIICANGGDVLNVGFGMGIIDEEIQRRHPRSHTIIEAHPDVYARMLELGWDKKPGVRVLFGRWQDVIEDLKNEFDGIFWDTYAEYYEDQRDFHNALPQLLRPGGVYSFFNGLAPDNIFFHLVYGEIARRELNALGFSVKYDAIKIDASSEETWKGVANRYWHLPVYFMPTCVLLPEKGEVDEEKLEKTQDGEKGKIFEDGGN